MKKIISLLLAISLFSGVGIVLAENNKDYSMILSDNAESKDNWVIPADVNGTIQEMTEGETDFVRFIPSAANDYMYINLPGDGVEIENSKMTEIDIRVRGYEIDGGKARMQIKWNMPKKLSEKMTLIYNGSEKLSGKVSFNEALGTYTADYGAGANHLVLADFLSNGVRLSNGVYTNTNLGEQSNWNTGLASLTKGKLNSKWWRMVIQIKPGYEVTYKLYDENNNMVGTEQKGTLGWVDQSGYLKSVAIQSFNGKLDYADVDYVKVSTFEDEVTSELLGAEKIGWGYEIKLDDYFKVKFDLPIDKNTLNDDNVKLFDIDKELQLGIKALEYDETENILTITPEKDLEHGNYKITLSENIKTIDIYPTLSEKFVNLKNTEYIIKYYASNPPEIVSVEIEGERLVGKTLTGKYTYISPDDVSESEEGSELRWYISDKQNGQFELAGEVENLTLEEKHHGKFIKLGVTPKDETGMKGSEAFSEVLGPVVNNWTEDTNLVSENVGFETGTTNRWIAEGTQKIAIVEDAYSGNYALEVSVANAKWGYKGIQTKANTAYLVSVWAKSTAGNKPMYWYSWDGARSKDFDFCNYNASGKEGTGILAGSGTTVSTDWTNVSDVMVSYKSFSATPAIVYWGATSSFIVDDFYIGELMISEIEADVPEKISIPEDEDVEIPVENIKVKNQLGTTVGFENAPVRFELSEDVAGVKMEENKLIISKYATVGRFDIKVICDPFEDTGSVRYSGVDSYETIVTVELEGNGNAEPKVYDAELSGVVEAGNELVLDYTFYQLYGEEDKSEITWWYSEDKTGEFRVIEGASGKTYKVNQDKGYFKVKIVPKTENGEGTAVWTNIIGAKEAPVASNVQISGRAFVGETLIGGYNYSDFNEDAEGDTIFRWLRAESEKGEYKPIENATEKNYVLTEEDIDKYIKFEVTPVSTNEPFKGNVVLSDAFEGPKPPEAKNVKIEKKGNSYVGSYEYYQSAGAQEGKSLYKWTVDGKIVSTDISYTPDFSGRKTVEFEITPVSVEKPYEGKAVSASVVVGKTSSGGGGGGGSSSGGGTPTMVGITTVVKNSETPSEKMTDIKGHWGENAVKWAIDNEIMDTETATTFEPDRLATRKEIITYMAKVLKWEKSQYMGIFSDVDGEFGDLLQTFVDKDVISVDVEFRPDDFLTRQELSKIMAISLGMTSENKDKTIFSDNSEIGEWAIPYVNAVYEAGLIKGVGNNSFAPQGNVTRAQLATLLQRISDKNEG